MTDIRVLVVMDEDEIRDQVVKRLLSGGLTATGVKDSAGALTLLTGAHFHVILLGGRPPQAQSLYTLKQIKAGHPDTQVIILTEDTSVEFGISAMKAGAFDFVVKPAPLSELLDKIRQASSLPDD